VDRFILISTDKAVNPTNVMGASKRLAELIVQKQSQGSGTSFCTVRFGNVLGSNGSVIPRFLEQIKNGGPVTITHPEIKRFFMLIPEAVQLVLHAAAQGRGGATYVLEMGEQVRLLDMARDLIRLSGLVHEEDIPIEFVGLRPGEKLYEELVGLGEDVHPSSVEKVLCVTARRPPEEGLVARIEALEASAAAANTKAVLAGLKQLIPEYHDPGTSSVVTQHDEPATVAVEAAMAMGASDLHRPCPKCASVMHRSRTRRWHERVHRKFTERRPFRCGGCGYRAWLVPLQFGPQATMPIEGAPDLAALDALATAPASPHRQSFSPRDLQ
jgi:hypothetical protein